MFSGRLNVMKNSSEISDGYFGWLPKELLSLIISYLNLEDYISFADTSRNHYERLTGVDFFEKYNPVLATVLKVTLFFIKNAFGTTFDGEHIPLDNIKEIIPQIVPLYNEVKAQLLTTEIEADETILISMLNCRLSGMDGDAKKQLKLEFVYQLFEDYFKIRSHFIFDPKQAAAIFADPIKLEFLITCINQDEAGSFRVDTVNDNLEKIKDNMVVYLYAKHKWNEAMNHQQQKGIGPQCVQWCIASSKVGAKNTIFLPLRIHRQLGWKNLAETLAKVEEKVRELLDEKAVREKFSAELLSDTILMTLSDAPTKTLKILAKLLKNNSIDEVRSLDKEPAIWSCLVNGVHSLEFLNAFQDKVARLQELHAAKSLEFVCNSSNAFILGKISQKEVRERPARWMIIFDPLLKISEVSVTDLEKFYRRWIALQEYYPDLSFVDLYWNINAAGTLLGLGLAEKELTKLTEISFPILMKIARYPIDKLEDFLKFLLSQDGADLYNYFKTDYQNLENLKTKKKPVDILLLKSSEFDFYFQFLTRYYKYFQKIRFSIPKILQMPKETLAIVKNYLVTYEYLFEHWTDKEIRRFIKLIHLASSRHRKSNKHLFIAMMPLSPLLKNTQGQIISFADFKKLIDSKVVEYMKVHSCELLYQQLGLKILGECSCNEVIVDRRSINLLQALSNLDVSQLKQVLEKAQGDMEQLKKLVMLSTSVLHSTSANYFPAQPGEKRSHQQISTEEISTSELPDADIPTNDNSKLQRLSPHNT